MKRVVMRLPKHLSMGPVWTTARKLGVVLGRSSKYYLERLGFTILDDSDNNAYSVAGPDWWTFAWNDIKEEGIVYDDKHKPRIWVKAYRLAPLCCVFELQFKPIT